MVPNWNNISSKQNFVEETENFTIPQQTYNQMVYDILWDSNITEETILWFVSLQEKVKKRVEEVCNKNNYSIKDFLQRSIVWLRTEKHIENISLLEHGKNSLRGANKMSDEEIISEMKSLIWQKSSKFIVKWPDGSINYLASNDKLIAERKRQKSIEEQKNVAEENATINRQKAKNTLNTSDFQLLDEEIKKAAKISDKLGKGKPLEMYLKWKFPSIQRLYWGQAQKYFYPRYLKLYNDNFPNIVNEIYPPDRKIINVTLSHRAWVICKVRWEKHIVWLVVDKINSWKIKLIDYIENEMDRAKIELIVQKLIDEYYQFLRMYEYKTISKSRRLRLEPLDLDKIKGEFSIFKDKDVYTLSDEEFNNALKSQAISAIETKAKWDKITKENKDNLIANIPQFNGFSSILDDYKPYLLSALENDDPSLRKRMPSRIKNLEQYWFVYIKQWNKMRVDNKIWFKLKQN